MLDPTGRFSNRVDDYRKYRPSYPPEAIAFILRACGLKRGSKVADLGSGTGIFAKLLLELGLEVFGIEPNREMRLAAEDFLAEFSGFQSIEGRAEATRLADSLVDVITAAQAFHWFELEAARSEFARILKPDGAVAVVWNARKNDATAFLRDYEEMLLEYGVDYQNVLHRDLGLRQMEEFFGHTDICFREFEYHQYLDLEGFKGRVFSSSYTPTPDHPNYRAMLDRIHEIFALHNVEGKIDFEYDTQVYCGGLKG